MTASPDLEAVAGRGVEVALAEGADAGEAYGQESTDLQIRVYEGEVESLSDAGGRGLGLRVFKGERSGYAYGTDLSGAGLNSLAKAALAAAEVSDPDEFGGLPAESGEAEVDGLASPELSAWSTEQKVELAVAIERAARARGGVSQVEDTVYADSEVSVALANSNGFTGSYQSTAVWAYASAFAGEGEDLMTGLGLGLGRDPAGLDAEAIGAEAAERALALRGARPPETRRCPVVLDPFVAASFIGLVGGTLSADAVQRGRSLFAGREGEEIASGALRLTDDGIHPDGPGSAPFDGEGSPCRSTPLIEDGVLRSFLYDARTARKGGCATTGNAERGYRSPPSVAPTNLVLEAGTRSFKELLAEAGEGVYVTDVAGLHSGVNPISGTFSVGATGRLIEGGELGSPVREMTIASDLVSMLKAVISVGSETRWVPFGGSVLAAPLLIGEMSVAGS